MNTNAVRGHNAGCSVIKTYVSIVYLWDCVIQSVSGICTLNLGIKIMPRFLLLKRSSVSGRFLSRCLYSCPLDFGSIDPAAAEIKSCFCCVT